MKFFGMVQYIYIDKSGDDVIYIHRSHFGIQEKIASRQLYNTNSRVEERTNTHTQEKKCHRLTLKKKAKKNHDS